jgi:domain of unknown function (DUF1934)
MFYPAKFLTHLVSRLPDGGTDELHHEENVMISLRDDGTWALRYNDPENGGQTMLQGTEHHLSVSRSGHIVSRLLFRIGERCESVYRTPNGEFEMSTLATLYNAQVDDQRGTLELHYDLFFNGALTAHNELTATWERT